MPIKFITQDVPDGFSLAIYNKNGEKYLAPLPQFHSILHLRHGLFDKLDAIPKIVKTMKLDILELFSEEDILILNKIKDNFIKCISKDTLEMIDSIIKKNRISYKNAPFKKIQEILNIPNIREIYTQKTYRYFTKWFDLSGINNAGKKWSEIKITSIINNKIYLPFPREFNDKFDCQLHLCDEDLKKMTDLSIEKLPALKQLYLIINNMFLCTSFSLNDPLMTTSNHMWGLYGDKGNGIALIYDLDMLIAVVNNNFYAKNGQDFIFFDKVDYKDDCNPHQYFIQFWNEYSTSNNGEAINKAFFDFTKKFVFTKSTEWEHEKEIRFNINTLDAFNGFVDAKSPASLNSCELLENHLQKSDKTVNHEISHINPVKIILGWKNNIEDQDIKSLITYANKKSITVTQLLKHINYEENKFYSYDIN